MAITVSEFKFNYRGQWQSSTLYLKNDIVQYNNAAYVCLQNIPDEWKIAMDKQVDTQSYFTGTPEIYFADKRPDLETQYWRLIVRGNQFKRGWGPHKVYTYGDVVRYGGDLFMYTGTPGSGATATATINGQGSIVSVTVTNGGIGYSQAPLVTFGFDSMRGSFGASGYATVANGSVVNIVITNPGIGYQTAPTVNINFAPVRNTHPEDPTYWVRIFTNPNRDSRRLYGAVFPNHQPLGWTRNNGDYPNPTISDGNSVQYIGVDGVPYSCGFNYSPGPTTSLNTAGRGVRDWVASWQASSFTFVDWLRSTDNQTGLGLGVLANAWLPTPDGLSPRCIQWVRTYNSSCWVFNNGEVYYSGYNNSNGMAGNGSTSQYNCTTRVTNLGTTGWIGETWPRSFNQTKIIKVDATTVGMQYPGSGSIDPSWFAIGNDGSMWAWGNNTYSQLGLGSTNATTNPNSTGLAGVSQTSPIRIPASYFDNKKIVDFICFGGDYGSCLALDEDGELWGWGTDYSGELGMGGQYGLTYGNQRLLPTRVPFDFRKYGGIKKMSYAHSQTSANTPLQRFVMILTNDGSLFGAGVFPVGQSPTEPFYTPANSQTNTQGQVVNRFTKYMTTNYNIKQVDNFWIIGGDTYSNNVFIREKDTGLTYGMGDNTYNTISSQPAAYKAGANGVTGPWTLIRGPRNVVAITNNEAGYIGSGNQGYFTIVMLDENGRVWGQGYNNYGSLSLGYAGQSIAVAVNDPTQDPEAGGQYHYWPIRTPSNTRINAIMGFGLAGGNDISAFMTDDGQVLFCGGDGTTPGSASSIGSTNSVQGQLNWLWRYRQITSTSNNYTLPRYTMHSLVGD